MSTRLALGAVGALVGLAALGRRGGARNVPYWAKAGPPEPTVFRVWHQTTPEAEAAIRVQGFRLDLPLARVSDHEMPDGVFLKFTDDPVGVVPGHVMAPVQMLVRAEVSHVLRVQDRAHLAGLLKLDPEYRRRLAEREQLDVDYRARIDALEAQEEEVYARAYAQWMQIPKRSRPSRMPQGAFQKLDAQIKRLLTEWSRLSDEKSAWVRERGTAFLRELGHDAVLMERDVGTRDRVVRTLVVMDPANVTPLERP